MLKNTSFQTTIGGLGALLGAAWLIKGMIMGTVPIDEPHVAIITGFLGAAWAGIKGKDAGVTGIGGKATRDPSKDATKPTNLAGV